MIVEFQRRHQPSDGVKAGMHGKCQVTGCMGRAGWAVRILGHPADYVCNKHRAEWARVAELRGEGA